MYNFKHTNGPWKWSIEDYSMATLRGPRELEDEVMSVGPCKSCQGFRKDDNFKWGACNVPNVANAKLIESAPDLVDILVRLIKNNMVSVAGEELIEEVLNKLK